MKKMIIAPHLDDEVLGCSSWLKEEDLVVVYTTKTHPYYPEVQKENDELAKIVGFRRRWISNDSVNQLDIIGQAYLIQQFEIAINEEEPNVLLVPAPSYNQDHRAVYDAVLTACRPHDRNWFPKIIMTYEQPETWGTMRTPYFFRPNYFRKLLLEWKLWCYSVYATQVRGHRSVEHIKAIASFRGMQSEMEYAEAFEVLRWID